MGAAFEFDHNAHPVSIRFVAQVADIFNLALSHKLSDALDQTGFVDLIRQFCNDNSLAFTSHLPFIVSSALASMVPQEVSELIGSGFRSVSRLAATPSSMMLGVLQSNRENVLKVLRFYQKQLSIIESALVSKDDAALESILKSAESSYHAKVH